jgi:hypothetical protein
MLRWVAIYYCSGASTASGIVTDMRYGYRFGGGTCIDRSSSVLGRYATNASMASRLRASAVASSANQDNRACEASRMHG